MAFRGSLLAGKEPPGIEWETRFGGPYDDRGNSVKQTLDGGYIVVGGTYVADNSLAGQVYLLKLDPSGTAAWQKTFGGPRYDEGYSVEESSDGGYVVVGLAGAEMPFGFHVIPDNFSVYLLKTDNKGELIWEKTFGDVGENVGWQVRRTSDGGYVIVGSRRTETMTCYDILLMKTDGDGNLVWQKGYGREFNDYGYAVDLTSDGGYVLAGVSQSVKGEDLYVVKTDASGTALWDKTFGRGDYNRGSWIKETAQRGYIVIGTIALTAGGDQDVYLVNLNKDGGILWEQMIGGPEYQIVFNAKQTEDGGFVVAGVESGDVLILRTDPRGAMVWKKTFGTKEVDGAMAVEITKDKGYLLVGESRPRRPNLTSSYDLYVAKLSPEGSSSTRFIRGDSNGDERVDITDAVFILLYLFQGGHIFPCYDAADADDTGAVNITDSIYLLDHLFKGGPAPPAPYPTLGIDRTQDSLICPGL